MSEERRKELELRLARLQEEKERRASVPDATMDVDVVLEADEGDEDSWFEDFGEGITASLMKTGYGVMDLVGGVGEGEYQLDPERLIDWQEDASESSGGTVGNIVGEVGQLLTGGGLLTKGALKAAQGAKKVGQAGSLARQALTKATNVATSPGIAREATIAGGLGGLQYADEQDSRLGNALANAALVGVGGAVATGIGKAVKGAEITKSAQKIFDEGGVLSPGQAVKHGGVRAMENLMSTLPTLARGTQVARDRGSKAWGDFVANTLGKKLGVRTNGFSQATNRLFKIKIRKGYEDAWGLAPGMSSKTLGAIRRTVEDSSDNVTTAGAGTLNKILKEAERLAKAPDGKGKQLLDGFIKKNKSQEDIHGINDALDAMHAALRGNINKPAREALAEMDKLYPEFKTFERVMNSVKTDEIVTPEMLLNASRFVGRKGNKAASGRAPLQREAKIGAKTVGRKEPKILFDVLKGVSQNIPSPQRAMDAAGRAVLGQTRIQKAAQPHFSKLEEMARQLRERRGVGINSIFAGMEQ